MKILAVDTSSKTAYVSIAEIKSETEAKSVLSYSYEAPSHTTTLTRMIDSALKLSSLTFEDIDLYAATIGPGSFTGIRIGVSVIKGFAMVDLKPCVGVSSLDALAFGAKGSKGLILPLIDARRGTFYNASYISSNTVTKLSVEGQLETDEILTTIKENSDKKKIILTGDGAEKIAKVSAENGIETDIAISDPAFGAAIVAFSKYTHADNKVHFNDCELVPVYLKKSQAEREREERLAEQQK